MLKILPLCLFVLIFASCHARHVGIEAKGLKEKPALETRKNKKVSLRTSKGLDPQTLLVQLKAPDPQTRIAAKDALIKSDAALEHLIDALEGIVEQKKPAIDEIIEKAANASGKEKKKATDSLMRRADEAIPPLLAKWQECRPEARRITSIWTKETEDKLAARKVVSKKKSQVTKVSAKVYPENKHQDVSTDIEKYMQMFLSDSREERVVATQEIVSLGKVSVLPLRRGLEHMTERTRVWSVTALGRLRDQGSLEKIKVLAANDPSYTVRRRAETAIKRIEGLESL